MEINNNPLVSVVVVTYNSSKYVIETLESIYNQTYQNIELIITDDCSKDNTIEICQEWLINHQERFVKTELLTVDKNTGTAGNLNRGYNKASSKWIKSIAGDDILIENCIELNVAYILSHPNTEILFSKVQPIGDNKIISKYSIHKYGMFDLSPRELLYLLLNTNFLPAPTLFIHKDIYNELDGFDENFPLLEDWPFWIKALNMGKKMSFNNEYTVYYRMSEDSISLSSTPNPLYIKSLTDFKTKYLKRCQKKTNIFLWIYYTFNTCQQKQSALIKRLMIPLIYINPISFYMKYIYRKLDRESEKYN